MAEYAHARRAAALWAAVLGAGFGAFPARAMPDTWFGMGSPLWDTPPNWSLFAKPSLTDDAIFVFAPPSGLSITLGPGEVAKSLAFSDSYLLSGGSLTLSAGGTISVDSGFSVSLATTLINTGTAYTKAGAGTLNIGPQSNGTGSVFATSAGTTNFFSAGGSSVTINTIGAGFTNFDGAIAQSIKGLGVGSGGNVQIISGSVIAAGLTSFTGPGGINLMGNSGTITGAGNYVWSGALTLSGFVGASTFNMNRDAASTGIVSITGSPFVSAPSGVTLNAGGTGDPFTDTVDSTKHVGIMNSGTLNVSGSKTLSFLSGGGGAPTGSTTNILAGAAPATLSVGGIVQDVVNMAVSPASSGTLTIRSPGVSMVGQFNITSTGAPPLTWNAYINIASGATLTLTGMVPMPTGPIPGASTSPVGTVLNINSTGGTGGTVNLANPGGNTFAGMININNTTLLASNFSGPATGSAVTAINSGGRLAGTGTLGGEVDVNGGGTLGGTLTIFNSVFAGQNGHIAPGALGSPTPGILSISDGFTALTMFSSYDGSPHFDYDLGSTPGTGDLLSVSGSLALTPATLNISGGPGGLSPGAYPIISHPSGAISGDASGWVVGSNTASGFYSYAVVTSPTEVTLLVTPVFTPHAWSVDAAGSWSGAGNWMGGVPGGAGDFAFFHGAITAPHTITVNGAFTLGHISFDNSKSYTIASDGIGGHGLSLASGGAGVDVTAHVGSHFISAPLSLMESATFGVAGGATLTVSGTISGAPLTKTGPGFLVLSGSNSFGGAILNGGVLSVSSDANLGGPGAPIMINRATLDATSTFTSPRPMLVSTTGSTIHVASGASFTAGGMIAGSVGTASLRKNGPGKLILAASNTFSGGLNISEGTVAVASDANLGSPSGGIVLDATAGLGPTLQASSSFVTSRSTFLFNFGTLATSNCNFQVDPGVTFGITSSVFGGGFMEKTGTGTLALASASGNTFGNAFAGLMIDAGRVVVSNTSGFGTGLGVVTVKSGGTLGGPGSAGGVTVLGGGHLAPGASAGGPDNSLDAFAATLSSGASLDFDLSMATAPGGLNDLITISGSGAGVLTLAPTVVNLNAFDPTHDLANGTYTLMTYPAGPGALVGTTAGWTIGTSNVNGPHTYSFSSATPGMIQLIVSPSLTPPQWAVDASGSWSVGANWSAGIPSGIGALANFGTVITATKAVTVDGAFIVGKIFFNNASGYIIASDGMAGHGITLDNSPAPGSITDAAGSHTITAPLTIPLGGASITVSSAASTLTLSGALTTAAGSAITMTGPGTLTIGGPQSHGIGATFTTTSGVTNINTDAGAGGANLTVHADPSTINFNSTQHLASVIIDAGSVVKLSSGADKKLVTGALSVDSAGKLDLFDNDMVVKSGPVASVAIKITSGFDGGDWLGSGITSTSAAGTAGSAHPTALGYSDASSIGVTTFAGESVAGTDILVRYTYSGDANLDGVVNALDFSALASNFGAGSGKLWVQGDFNYDGVTNTLDFNSLAASFNLALPSPPALGMLIPEPTTLILASPAIFNVFRRRRATRATHTVAGSL